MKRQISETRGEQFGRAFEHFIFMEIQAYSSIAAWISLFISGEQNPVRKWILSWETAKWPSK